MWDSLRTFRSTQPADPGLTSVESNLHTFFWYFSAFVAWNKQYQRRCSLCPHVRYTHFLIILNENINFALELDYGGRNGSSWPSFINDTRVISLKLTIPFMCVLYAEMWITIHILLWISISDYYTYHHWLFDFERFFYRHRHLCTQ